MDICHLKRLSLRCLQNETNAPETDKSMAASHTKLHHNSFFLRIARVEENDRQDLRKALSLPQAAPMRWVWLVTIVKRPGKEEFSHPSWRSKKNTCNIMEQAGYQTAHGLAMLAHLMENVANDGCLKDQDNATLQRLLGDDEATLHFFISGKNCKCIDVLCGQRWRMISWIPHTYGIPQHMLPLLLFLWSLPLLHIIRLHDVMSPYLTYEYLSIHHGMILHH